MQKKIIILYIYIYSINNMHSTSSSILKEYLLQRYIIPITEKKTAIDILCVCIHLYGCVPCMPGMHNNYLLFLVV